MEHTGQAEGSCVGEGRVADVEHLEARGGYELTLAKWIIPVRSSAVTLLKHSPPISNCSSAVRSSSTSVDAWLKHLSPTRREVRTGEESESEVTCARESERMVIVDSTVESAHDVDVQYALSESVVRAESARGWMSRRCRRVKATSYRCFAEMHR